MTPGPNKALKRRLREALQRAHRRAIRDLIVGRSARDSMARVRGLRSYLRRLDPPEPAKSEPDLALLVLVLGGIVLLLGTLPWPSNRIRLEVNTNFASVGLASPVRFQTGQISRFRDLSVSGNVGFSCSALPELCPLESDSRALIFSGTRLSFERWEAADSTLTIERDGPALQITTFLAQDGGEILLDSSAVTVSPCFGDPQPTLDPNVRRRDVDQWFVSVVPIPETSGRVEISGTPIEESRLGALEVDAMSFIRSWNLDPVGTSEILGGELRFTDAAMEQPIRASQRVVLRGLQSGALATLSVGEHVRVILDAVVRSVEIDGRSIRPNVLQYATTYEKSRILLGASGFVFSLFLSFWRKQGRA